MKIGQQLELCTVGTELLLGQTVDTNAAYLGRQLARIGVQVLYRSGVGDNLARMVEVMELALRRSGGVIVTGGLGPTQDDLTAQAMARIFGRSMVTHQETLEQLRERAARLDLKISESSFRMAEVPEGADILSNGVGAAPGLWMEDGDRLAIALPGVPSEMRNIVEEHVLPRLRRRAGEPIRSRVLRLVGITESLAEERILDLVQSQENPTIAPYAGMGEVKIRITARAHDEAAASEMISAVEAEIRRRLKGHVYGVDEETLDLAVGRELLEKQLTICTAESCTAGLVSAALTELPGSSAYLVGGIAAYSNQIKQTILGVSPKVLDERGAVSAETARAMAEGARALYSTDLAISVTGIAGPDGGSSEKPVGLVYLALAHSSGVRVERRQFGGDRSGIRQRSVMAALQMIHDHLSDDAGG